MYGWNDVVKHMCTNDDGTTDKALSMDLADLAIMTLVSGLPAYDVMLGARINVFSCLMAPVGGGKDTAMDRAIAMLDMRSGVHYLPDAPAGERALAAQIGDKPPKSKGGTRIAGPRKMVLVTYELEDTLAKTKTEASGLIQAMTHIFDHNERLFGCGKTNTTSRIDCRLSWGTCLPMGKQIEPERFAEVFDNRSTQGLLSRFVFAFSESRFDQRKSRKWKPPTRERLKISTEVLDAVGGGDEDSVTELEELIPTATDDLTKAYVDGFAPGVEEAYLAWESTEESGRLTYYLLKRMILTSCFAGETSISMACFNAAKLWAERQSRIKQVFAPSQAKNATPMATFQAMAMRAFERETERRAAKGEDRKEIFIRWRGVSNHLKWGGRGYGVDIEKAIDMLVRGGSLIYKIVEVEKVKKDRTTELITEPDKRWVSVI